MPAPVLTSARTYLLQEAALLLAIPYLLLLAATSNGIVNYDIARFSLGVLTAVVAAWLVAVVWRGRGGAGLPLGWPLASCLAVYLLAAFTSIDPRRSLPDAWLLGAYAFAFVLTANLVQWGWPRELFVKALLLTGGVLIGMGVYTIVTWYQQWLAANPGVWLPTVSYRLPAPNTIAIFLNLLLMAAMARWWVTRALAPRIFLSVWIGLALGLLFLTTSRGGWLGTMAGVAMTVAAGRGARGPERGEGFRPIWEAIRRSKMLLVIALLIGVAGLGGVGWLAYRQMAHPTHASSFLVARGNFWIAAWQAFLRSPLVGQGPFTYGSAFTHVRSAPPDLPYTHAHSTYINLLAETGLLGVIAGGWLGAAAFRTLWRQVHALRGDERAVAVGAFGALAAGAVHGLFETVSAEPSNAFAISILVGAALAPGPAPHAAAPRGLARRWPMIALGLALVTAGWYGVWLSAPLRLGVLAANKSDWRQAASHLAEAARRDPRSAVVHQQLGLARSVLASQGSAGALSEAVAEFEIAARLDPDWALNHANLGALYAAQGDDEAALNELRTAARLAPLVAAYHLNLGLAAERANRASEAEDAYAAALSNRPEWAEAYFWRATPFRSECLSRWQASNPAASAPTVAELEAAVAAHSESALTYARLAEVYVRAGRLSEAERLLQRAELTYAGSAEKLEIWWVRAALAAAQGNGAEAVRLGEKAFAGYRDQSIFGPGTFGDPSYGPFLFRREAMALDMVPQLTVIRLTDPWAARMVTLGDWRAALGDDAGADAVYREVLEHVPDNADAQMRLK
jgi:tetratricopeptide (TPR) repeat protein